MNATIFKAAAIPLACGALFGCAGRNAISQTATADLQQALAAGCPILTAIRASGPPTNTYQRSAIATLAQACPPNPPPASVLVAVGDIVAAYMTLQPLSKP